MIEAKLYGVSTAMLTSFHADGSINPKAQQELTEFLIEKGVDCLYPLGTTGEMWKMSLEERKEIAQAVVEKAAGRKNVFIHIGDDYTPNAVELARHAKAIGAVGIAAVTPSYGRVNDNEMEQYFISIAKCVTEDFPLYLYNIPQNTGNDIPVEVAKKLAHTVPNIIGIKYSWADLARVQQYKDISESFSILHGADTLFLELLAMGLDGTISGTSSVYPEPFVAIQTQWEKGNIDNCRYLEKVARMYADVIHSGDSISHMKEALRYRGINAGPARLPSQPVDAEEAGRMAARLKELDAEYLNDCIDMCKG